MTAIMECPSLPEFYRRVMDCPPQAGEPVMSDEQVIERVKSSLKGRKLWDGEIDEYDGMESVRGKSPVYG